MREILRERGIECPPDLWGMKPAPAKQQEPAQ
jgi:hypothetical protein